MQIVKRPAQEVIASFPAAIVVDLDGLHAVTRYAIVSPGEKGYQPLYIRADVMTLDELDAMLVERGRADRKPTPAERRAAVVGSMFGWDVPGADPLNCEVEA